MNVTQDLSIISLIWNASAVVQFVMALLLIVSFMSWYWIFRKAFAVRASRSQTEKFERDFWGGSELGALYQSAVNHRHSTVVSLKQCLEDHRILDICAGGLADLTGGAYRPAAVLRIP